MSAPVVIVGASLAAASTVERLRETGFDGPVIVVGDEPHMPYNRPPLSKEVMVGLCRAGDTELPRPRTRRDHGVSWRLGTAATGLDIGRKTVTLADGEAIPYSKLLIATGTRARPWPDQAEGEFGGVVTLRGRDDAERLHRLLEAGPRHVVIVGGGFMGSELAASCRKRDLSVTIVDRGPAPLAGALGATVAASATRLQRQNGVDLRTGTSVKALAADASGRVCRVELDNGDAIEADLVIAALGAVPNTEWLEGSGVGVGPFGVACDAGCRVYSTDMMVLDDVFVAGDVAAFPHPLGDGALVRLEHWDNAVQMGWIAAHNMVCAPHDRRAHLPIPAFWSSQYDTSIKSLGILSGAEEVMVTEGSLESGDFTAVYGRKGRLVGVVSFNHGRTLPPYERLIAEGHPFPPAMTTNNPPREKGVMPAGFRERSSPSPSAFAAFAGDSFTDRSLRWTSPTNPN